MKIFLLACFTALASLQCLASDSVEKDAIFYQWKVQYWEWETKERDPDEHKIPKGAKVSDLQLIILPDQEGSCETRIGDLAIGLALVPKLNVDNEPLWELRCWAESKGARLNETKRSVDLAGMTQLLAKKIQFGKTLWLQGGSHRPGDGDVTYSCAFTCIVEKKSREDVLRLIKSHSSPPDPERPRDGPTG